MSTKAREWDRLRGMPHPWEMYKELFPGAAIDVSPYGYARITQICHLINERLSKQRHGEAIQGENLIRMNGSHIGEPDIEDWDGLDVLARGDT